MPNKFPTPIMVHQEEYEVVKKLRDVLAKKRMRPPTLGATVAEASQRMLDEEIK